VGGVVGLEHSDEVGTLFLTGDERQTPHQHLINLGSRVAQRSKALHVSARGVTTDPGLIPVCITTDRDCLIGTLTRPNPGLVNKNFLLTDFPR
jgi:hypothetical protein